MYSWPTFITLYHKLHVHAYYLCVNDVFINWCMSASSTMCDSHTTWSLFLTRTHSSNIPSGAYRKVDCVLSKHLKWLCMYWAHCELLGNCCTDSVTCCVYMYNGMAGCATIECSMYFALMFTLCTGMRVRFLKYAYPPTESFELCMCTYMCTCTLCPMSTTTG